MKNRYFKSFFTLTFLSLFIASHAQRVSDQLQALYTFREGGGEFVEDVSGTGYPLLLHILNPSSVQWITGGGLDINQAALIKSLNNANKIGDACQASQAITIEAWVKPDNSSQNGPSRIATISHGASNRNWTIAQKASQYSVSVRTSSTNANGTPALDSPNGSVQNALQHVVYTLNAQGQEKIYINGALVSSGNRTGNFSSWINNYELALANEIDASKPWLGEYHLCAFYSKALSLSEIQQNYAAGFAQGSASISIEQCSNESCFIDGYGTNQRIMWLPAITGPSSVEYKFGENGGHMEVFPDGTAHIYGATYNINDPQYGWYIDFWLKDKMNWTEWSALGRSWKGTASIVGTLYQTWDYYIMDAAMTNVLIGTGNFAGSQLNITHKPSDYYYGFQLGIGANDKNILPGMSSWFDYTGTLNGNSVSGNGDFNCEGECINLPVLECAADINVSCEMGYMPEVTGSASVNCESEYTLSFSDQTTQQGCEMQINRTWTAINTIGQEVSCSQSITLVDAIAPVIEALPSVIYNCLPNSSELFGVTDNCDSSPNVTISVTDSTWISQTGCTPGMFRTQTQGGWGASPNGNNPGVYLHNYFASAFPNGLVIGCGNNTLTLTNAQAVTDFLPSGTTPTSLPSGNQMNPGSSYSNVLAGQLVALTLSVGFDNADPNFGSSNSVLSSLVVSSGSFQGYSIGEILTMANQIIGGCSSEFSFSELNSVLTSLNENFDNSTINNGFVDCSLFNCYLQMGYIVTASDDCGNTSTLNQSVMVVDNQAPTFDGIPVNVTINCGETIPTLTLSNDCFSDLIDLSFTDTEFSGACLPTIERVYLATDQCGNTASFTQYIAVHDTQAPLFLNAPQNASIHCGDEWPIFIPQVMDECDNDVIVTSVQDITESGCERIVNITYTATDNCGNSTSVQHQITITDNQGPIAEGLVPEMTISCGDLPPANDVIFYDACGSVIEVNFTEDAVGSTCNQTIIRTWSAIDECGNTTVLSQTIQIADTTPPTFVGVPSNVSLPCGSSLPTSSPLAMDNCSDAVIAYNEVWNQNTGSCAQVNRTWVATDACGNSTVAVQTVTFIDQIPPVLVGVPSNFSGSCGTLPNPANVTATDNCDASVSVVLAESISQSGCNLQMIRTWTATDDCGNTTVASQTLTLSDQQAPQFSASPEITISCNELATLNIEASDDCSAQLDISFSDVVVGSGCSYDIIRSWLAADNCGNAASFTQTIHITDTTAPVFTSTLPDLVLSCGSVPPLETPTAVDNCATNVALTVVVTEGGTPCNYLINRTWTATDNCGNSSVLVQHVYLVDNSAPVLNGIPQNQTFECDAYVYSNPATGITASDNCDLNPVITFLESTTPGPCPSEFGLLRTWTATDQCGNYSSASQHIYVVDNTPPVFDFTPQDVDVQCAQIPAPPAMTAHDNCGSASVVMTTNSQTGGCPIITRTWTATDACGNTAQTIQHINIIDNEPPLITGIPPGGPVACNAIPPVPQPFVVDNCDENVDVSMNQTIVGSGCVYTLIRTFIAEDDCGNSFVVSQTFTVTDQSPPVFVNPQPSVTLTCSTLPGYLGPAVMDDCGSNVQTSFTDIVLGSGCSYDIQRSYVATDLCGNQATFTQFIHVIDNVGPLFSGVPLNSFANCNSIPSPPNVTANDACSGSVPVLFSQTTAGQGCFSQIIRTWTAIDICGNTSSVSRTIYVTDNEAPVLLGVPSNLVLSCTEAIPPVASPVAADNCTLSNILPAVTFNQTTTNLSCGQLITRTWTATDACGNQNTASQTITIIDDQAPVISGVPTSTTTTCDDIPTAATVTAIDACTGNVIVTFNEEVIPGACPYTILRTWTAVDACGNAASMSQEIFINDFEMPVLGIVPNDMMVSCNDIPVAPIVMATDNCRGEFEAEMIETVIALNCGKEIHRQWRAIDYCGNENSSEQIITVFDSENPVFTTLPEDILVDCGVLPAPFIPEVDDCSPFTIVYEQVGRMGLCANQYSLVRIWTATDGCGNSTNISQNVLSLDQTAPELSEYPNDTTVTCNHIPPVPAIVGMDNCAGETDVVFTEQIEYFGANDGSCQLKETVSPAGEVAILLPNLAGFDSDFVFGNNPGSFTEDLANGTAHVTGTVYNPNDPAQMWIIDFNLVSRRNWTDWSALGRSYKDDANAAGNNYVDWSYYELQAGSTLTGAGSFEGSILNCTHAPGSYHYGFQVGQGANNRNAEYGLSGWFYYGGYLNGALVYGVGDLMTENNCCPDQNITRTWTTMDCVGNQTTQTQVIHVSNNPTPSMMFVPGTAEFNSFTVTGSTSDQFVLNFNVFNSGQASIEMFDSKGQLIKEVYNGHLMAKTNYRYGVSKAGLDEGIYIFRMVQNHLMITEKDAVMK